MQIRAATHLEQDNIQSVYLSAFGEDERDVVAQLAVDLLSEDTVPPTLSWVAESDDRVVGHVAFSPVTFENHGKLQGYILSPLAVQPEFQKRRVGSNLIRRGIQELSQVGVDMLFVYGDPNYYGRFGFLAETAEGCKPPYTLAYPFGWQGLILSDVDAASLSTGITCVASLSKPTLW